MRLLCLLFTLGSTLYLMSSSRAEVIASADNGFVIEISTDVAASAGEAYVQFTRIHQWWDGEHSYFGSADNFYLEDKVGGCFCEILGDRQVEHMRVVYVDPLKEVRLAGGLGPLQSMGVDGVMSWRFEEQVLPKKDDLEQTKYRTTIIHRYAVSGFSPNGFSGLAKSVDRVLGQQLARLVAKIEGRLEQ